MTPTPGALLCGFRPGTTADCAGGRTHGGAFDGGAGYSFTLRRIRLVLHGQALALLQIHLILRVVLTCDISITTLEASAV